MVKIMMKKRRLFGLVFLSLSTVVAQVGRDPQARPIPVQPISPAIQRQNARIQNLIGPTTKQTVTEIAPGFSARLKQASPNADFHKLAISEITSHMKGSGNLSNEQLEVLAFI